MSRRSVRIRALGWALPFCALAGAAACGASDSSSGPGGASVVKPGNGAICTANADCASNVCTTGKCVGNGLLLPPGNPCTTNGVCASGVCASGRCSTGVSLANGLSCALSTECQSSLCMNGACADPSALGSGGAATSGTGQGGTTGTGVVETLNRPFEGLGVDWTPLKTGCGPETANQCGGSCAPTTDPNAKVIRPAATFCFGALTGSGIADPTPETPAAIIEQVIETVHGVSYVHVRVTFDPAFVDNTYGANASAGWYASANGKAGKGHTFYTDLTNSDHIELKFTDASGTTVMELSEDYIHSLTEAGGPKAPGKIGVGGATSVGSGGAAGVTSACGYANLGVLGGEGKMTTGNASDVLAAASSIDRNINGCGYCKSSACNAAVGAVAGATSTVVDDCTINSPLTDAIYTVNSATPNWNYAVVYEVWLKLSAFNGGFGQAYITFVHASPSKIPGNNTLYVEPTNCPPTGFGCPGAGCPGTGTGGAGGATGTAPPPECPPNYQVFITRENTRICTPIPYAGWPNMAPCPENYKFTVEQQYTLEYCLPSS